MRKARIALALATIIGVSLPILGSVMRSDWRVVRKLRARWRGATLLSDNGVRLQRDRTNCGQTALRSALELLHRPIPRPWLLAPREIGLSLDEIIDLSVQEGTPARQVRGGVEVLDSVQLPAVALVGTHYVTVAHRITGGGFIVLDPGIGRLLVSRDYLQQDWRGFLVVFDSGGSPLPRPLA